MSERSVAATVIETLRDMGVKHVFGVPSGGWVDFMEAIRTTDGIEFVLTTHEGGAAFMADVCGRLTGIPGVCFGTFGPGATNLATGVGSAQLDRSPMIALTDEMPTSLQDRVVQMGIDHQALMKPITKWTSRLSIDRVGETLETARSMATSGRPGAVHIGMPVDITSTQVPRETSVVASGAGVIEADLATIEVAQTAIATADKPLVALGLGAVRADIRAEVIAFAEAHGLPVVLTPMAKGLFPESHTNYAGVLFHALSDQVAVTHSQADLILAVGYDPVEFTLENWMPMATLVNVDDAPLNADPSAYTDCLQVEGDIATSFRAIAAMPATAHAWDLSALRARTDAMFAQMRPESDEFGPCAVLDVLREALPEDGIMTCDVGAHTHLIGQKWPTPAPGTQIMTNGWSAMGFGLPAAIAAKLCDPGRSVCTVIGDGGFLMSAGEIATAVRENINVIVVVLTDNDLALIRIKQQRKDNPIFGTPVREAEGTLGGDNIFGAPVLVAPDVAALARHLDAAFNAEGPVIVEALISSAEYDELVLRKDKP